MMYFNCVWAWHRQLLSTLILITLSSPSWGLVISTTESTDVTRPPTVAELTGGDPGFVNVANLGLPNQQTAVHIGYGWMLTTAHNSPKPVTFNIRNESGDITEELTYDFLTTTNIDLGNCDLRLFRLNEMPDLPALTIAHPNTNIPSGSEVVMIGRSSEYVPHNNGFEVPNAYAPRTIRWGTNKINVAQMTGGPTGGRQSIVFSTRFDSPSSSSNTDYEAQAYYGDSGGAVFHKNGDEWELNGIISAASNSPPLVLYNGSTSSVKLSSYYRQIYDNITMEGDANFDGIVDVSDLGILASNYGTTVDGGVDEVFTWDKGDFNWDGEVNATDLGILATAYGNTAYWYVPPVSAVPEPCVLMMALFGSITLLCSRRRWFAR